MTRGRFITLEGGEGVGKSTQLRALAAHLRGLGLDVVETREPGGSIGAEEIRTLLLSGEADKWNARAEALLFAAARADHVARRILPSLEAGQWVLCDRFIDSSRAYQSGASGLADADILALHHVGSGGLMPDRTLLLHLPQEEAAQRALLRDQGGDDRIGSRDAAYHARVAEAFAGFASQEPGRMRLIEDVTARLIAALADMTS
jgi:dTMP kinase